MLTIVVMAVSYWGGISYVFHGKTDFPHICLWYLSIYIYILHTSKLICITMRLWIFLSTDNVLTLQQSGTGGGQLVELPGWS